MNIFCGSRQPDVLLVATVLVFPIWLISLVVGTCKYMSNPSAPEAFHGSWSSFCYLGVPLVCFVKRNPAVTNGMLASAAFHLMYVSFQHWEVYNCHLWTAEQKAAHGLQRGFSYSGIVSDDLFAVLFVSCCVVGLSIEYLMHAFAQVFKVAELAQWSSLAGLLSGGVEYMVLQYEFQLERGRPNRCFMQCP